MCNHCTTCFLRVNSVQLFVGVFRYLLLSSLFFLFSYPTVQILLPQTSLFCRQMLLATYSPIVQADLAVHKKKVEEVRDWLTRAVAAGCTAPSPSLVSEPRIGLLTGPPGTSSVCGFLAGIKGNMTSSVCDNGTLFPVRGPHYSMDICFLLLFFPLSLSPFTFSLLNVGNSNDAALLERCWEKRHRQNARGRSWAGDYRMDQPIRTQVRGSLHLSSVLRSSSYFFSGKNLMFHSYNHALMHAVFAALHCLAFLFGYRSPCQRSCSSPAFRNWDTNSDGTTRSWDVSVRHRLV